MDLIKYGSAGVSSLLFTGLPYAYRVPREVQWRMGILTICSSTYHIHHEVLKDSKRTKWLERWLECLDGLAIILATGNFYMRSDTVCNLMRMYVPMKMVSNVEIIKRFSYFSGILMGIKDNPKLILPWMMGLGGLMNYLKKMEWNNESRAIWHVGNSILIGMAYGLE
jgi:hypothetical protein